MKVGLTVKIIAYVTLALMVTLILFGAIKFYFFKPTPNQQNFAPESKPTFHSVVNNMEYHWAVGPYIAATYEEDLGWECGLRLEYRF